MTVDIVSVSWSQLRAHEECKQKSHLIRSGKRGVANNIRGYYHGMVVDRVMRAWLDNPDHPAGEMESMVDDMMNTVAQQAIDDGDGVVRWKHQDDRAEVREFCIELVRRLEPILREHVLPHEFEQAKRFRVPTTVPYLDGSPAVIHLIGEMDLLVKPASGWIIWDLKGTRDDQYWRKVLGQLTFYDLAVYALTGIPPAKTGLIQPMCTQPLLEFAFTDDDRQVMWSRILRYVGDIWRHNVECKTGTQGCNYCDVRHACARYAPTSDLLSLGQALREAAEGELL